MKINAEQAIVKTMGVEIKTMAINNKQVTLAVFRQIERRSIWNNENLTLNGVIWGRVNYHLPNCDLNKTVRKYSERRVRHIHIVWSDGLRLYQDVIVDLRDEYADVESEHNNVGSNVRRLYKNVAGWEDSVKVEKFYEGLYEQCLNLDLLFIAV